jgi:hypothetical protein
MLPKTFSPTGDYTERQQDRARGYRLLAHAEIESYLEDISRETVTHAIKEWKANSKPSFVIISFIASYHSSSSASNELSNNEILNIAKSRKNIKKSVNEIIDLAQSQFTQKVRDNHGIKDKNFKTLVVPIGVDIDSLDQTWLTNLNSFGTERGKVAHQTKRAHGAVNPKDEYNSVMTLLSGLEDLDKKVIEISKGKA